MSSIFQVSERRLAASSQVDSGSSVKPASWAVKGAPETANAKFGRPGFFTILDVSTEYQIPYTIIENLGVTAPDQEDKKKINLRFGYSTGAGFSGRVIRHSTERDTGDVKKGTIVALKQFVSVGAGFGRTEVETKSLVFQAVRRELKALCHPRLRAHENICQVMYIGWHGESIYPMVALELAAYGTLEDVMTAPGMGPTWLQKMNITIDIISGLQAIHSSSMIHGDIKPGNFIVQHHETRQLVVKAIDFAGSRDLYDDFDHEFRPGMGTELWSSPEVCIGSSNIDWTKADAYSLGLVVASLWARPPIWSQEKLDHVCILERYLPRKFNASERRDRLIMMKTHTDLNFQSVMQLCWSDQAHINPIMLMTLSASNTWRVDGIKLGSLLLPHLCYKAGRHLEESTLSDSTTAPLPPQMDTFTVLDKGYIESNRRFRHLVYRQLLKASTPPGTLFDHLPPNSLHIIDVDSQVTKNIISQVYANFKRLEELATGLGTSKYGLFAHELAISHWLGLGTPRSIDAAMDNLYDSALAGCWTAFQILTVASVSKRRIGFEGLRRLILTLGCLIGSKVALKSLKSEFPEFYRAALEYLSLRPGISGSRNSLATFQIGDWLEEIISRPIADPRTFSLRECCETLNTQRAREILEMDSFDASFLDEGLSVFHYLTYLEDEDASSLAKLCQQRGANLSHCAQHGSRSCLKMTETPPSQTPLAWAWAYGMENYFSELLQLHLQYSIPVHDYYMLLFYCSQYHTPRSLQGLLKLATSAPNLVGSESQADCFRIDLLKPNPAISPQKCQETLDKRHLEFCAFACLSDTCTGFGDIHLLARIEHHGISIAEARLKTLQILADAGADVMLGIGMCLTLDDAASCRMLCAYWKQASLGEELFTHLSKVLHGSIHGHGVNDNTQQYDAEGAPKCFEVLLSCFPELAVVSECQMPCFNTPLCTAARMKNPLFARRLLELGANLDIEYDNNSPLALALSYGNIETAKTIQQYMTEQQSRRAFEEHPVSGFTMTGRLMWAWVRNHDPTLIEALSWLKSIGGTEFFLNGRTKEPAWSLILGRRPSPVQSHFDQDTIMLQMLFSIFPDHITDPYDNGYMPIHWAASHGYLGVMKSLVSMGVDINSEVLNAAEAKFPGRTPLDLAIWTRKDIENSVPGGIGEGGASELERWHQRCLDTLNYLRSVKAKSGSGSTDFEQKEAAHDSLFSKYPAGRARFDTSFLYEEERGKGTRNLKFAWPKILGPDKTSLPLDQIDQTKKWRKVHCAITNKVVSVSRHSVDKYLLPDMDQPRAGYFDQVPEAYTLWLRRTSAARRTLWLNSQLPSDNAFDPPVPPLSSIEFKEWHLHGWRPHDADRTIERLPQYRLVFFLGSPLSADSEENRNLAHLIQALHDNRLDENDLEGPNVIIVDSTFVDAGGVEQCMPQIEDMRKKPGSGIRFLLHISPGKTDMTKDQKKLWHDMGWDQGILHRHPPPE